MALTDSARILGWQDAASPLFVWGCWVAARVLFVHAFMARKEGGPGEGFEAVLGGLREMARYWGLASMCFCLFGLGVCGGVEAPVVTMSPGWRFHGMSTTLAWTIASSRQSRLRPVS